MAKDYVNGEHLLLIGNQGVGKNKLADKLLELLNIEREYIQLHRYYCFISRYRELSFVQQKKNQRHNGTELDSSCGC